MIYFDIPKGVRPIFEGNLTNKGVGFDSSRFPYLTVRSHEGVKHCENFTVQDRVNLNLGYKLIPGTYQGCGFAVCISEIYKTKINMDEVSFQDIDGKFDYFETMESFFKLLSSGNILPTSNLGIHFKVDETILKTYKTQSQFVITNTKKLTLLETSLIQTMNHVRHLEQIIQDHVLNQKKSD